MSIKKNLENLKEGSLMNIHGHMYEVRKKSFYDEDGWRWSELTIDNLDTVETQYLEWEEDDELEISLTTYKVDLEDIGLEKLSDATSFKKIKEVKKIEFKGSVFKKDDSYTAYYNNKHKVKVFEYYSKELNEGLSIEFWYKNNSDKEDGFEVEAFVFEELESCNIEFINNPVTN